MIQALFDTIHIMLQYYSNPIAKKCLPWRQYLLPQSLFVALDSFTTLLLRGKRNYCHKQTFWQQRLSPRDNSIARETIATNKLHGNICYCNIYSRGNTLFCHGITRCNNKNCNDALSGNKHTQGNEAKIVAQSFQDGTISNGCQHK